MPDLNAMRAQRSILNRQIAETEANAEGEFNFALGQLSDALYEHARKAGLCWADSSRKNWTTVVLNDSVTVRFGERSDYYGAGGLEVSAGAMTAEFDPLPTAENLTRLVDFLFTQEA